LSNVGRQAVVNHMSTTVVDVEWPLIYYEGYYYVYCLLR